MTEEAGEVKKKRAYVITCGDEGVQINEGIRLSFVGAGLKLEGFSKAVTALKDLLGEKIAIASNQENDWVKETFETSDWEQTDATMQQHVEALADKEGLKYSGYLPFTDPRKLKFDIKGHMVRPPHVHVANKICFTLGGGEQTYNLGCYQISAEWVHKLPKKLAEEIIMTQVEFYKKLASKGSFAPKDGLKYVYEMDGELDEKIAEKNKKALEKMGIVFEEPESEEEK